MCQSLGIELRKIPNSTYCYLTWPWRNQTLASLTHFRPGGQNKGSVLSILCQLQVVLTQVRLEEMLICKERMLHKKVYVGMN
jgi:hypothetical protein